MEWVIERVILYVEYIRIPGFGALNSVLNRKSTFVLQ
jgi:hypothetical protein